MNRSVKFQDKSIKYDVAGEGKTIVFLHGFLESGKMWQHFVKDLSNEFQIVIIDLPGFGKTPAVAEKHPMSLMAEAVKTVLDEIKIDSCIMIGHSMGGYIALEFAVKYPELLDGIGLFHSHASADTEEARENRRRTINIVNLNRKGFIHQFIPDLFAEDSIEKFSEEIEALKTLAGKTPAKGIIAALEGMKERSGKLDLLLKTKLPVLFIAGKEDLRIPIQYIMAQAILPEHSEVLILGKVGHMGFIEAYPETLGMIRSFCSRTWSRE